MSIAAPEIERLRKVYRLMESPVEAEAAAALAMTKALLAKHGMRMSDLPGLLNGNGSSSKAIDDLVAATTAAMAAAMAELNRKTAEMERRRRKETERQAETKARWSDAEQAAEIERAEARWKQHVKAKAEKEEANRRARWHAVDNSVRTRIQIQEEAVAAGFAPKDVLTYARGKLVSQLRARGGLP